MSDPKIPGGYYIKARAIQKSNIMRQPPHVREIWDYLLMNANHSDRKYGGYSIKRGQLFRTYKQIREDLSWNVGWRKETYNENQTKKAMKFLREALMIDTTKEPGGVLITICNYEFYQDPQNYERTSERTDERTIDEPSTNQPAPYNKNGNNKIMGKDNIADSVPESANLTIKDENGQKNETEYDQSKNKPNSTINDGESGKQPGSQTFLPGIGEQGTPQGSGCGMEANGHREQGAQGNDIEAVQRNGSKDNENGFKTDGANSQAGEKRYRTKKNRWLKGQRLADFEEFWKAFDYKKGKAAAADSWLDIKDYSTEKAKWIIYAAKKEAWERDDIIQRGGTPKWGQGWLTDRRWEDYPMEEGRSNKPARTREQIRAEVYAKYGRKNLQAAATGTNGKVATGNLVGEGSRPPGTALQVLFGK